MSLVAWGAFAELHEPPVIGQADDLHVLRAVEEALLLFIGMRDVPGAKEHDKPCRNGRDSTSLIDHDRVTHVKLL
jgi:hypothetical protein